MTSSVPTADRATDPGSAAARIAPAPAGSATLRVTKGHGTQNDFVVLDGRRGVIGAAGAGGPLVAGLDAALVRALADRRSGVGGDGVIRLIASADLAEGAPVLAEEPGATWFMDYRNADGSVAEMCGNGVRVFAAYLRRLGLWDPAGGELALGTRAGVRRVREVAVPAEVQAGPDDVWYAVDMGPWQLPGGAAAAAAGADAEVLVAGLDVPRAALRVDVGNPHTVLALAGEGELAAADLTRVPDVQPVPPHGTNVELVVPLGETTAPDGTIVGHVRMRVHERGVGETRSCGTGACAAALAVRAWAGPQAPDVWLVEVPGGTVRVAVLPDGHVELAGPAVLVADADVSVAALTY